MGLQPTSPWLSFPFLHQQRANQRLKSQKTYIPILVPQCKTEKFDFWSLCVFLSHWSLSTRSCSPWNQKKKKTKNKKPHNNSPLQPLVEQAHNTRIWLHLPQVPWAHRSIPVWTCRQSLKALPGFLALVGISARFGISLGACALTALVYFMWINFSWRPFSNISSFILWIPPGQCLQVWFFSFFLPKNWTKFETCISVTLDESPHLLES